MAVLLTTSYQQVATGTKSFTANGVSCAVKEIIQAKYDSIDEEAMKAVISVRTYVQGTKNSFTSSGNTQYIRIGAETKNNKYDIGKVTTSTNMKTAELTFTVAYDENGEYENVIIRAVTDVFSSYNVEAEGYISLPPIAVANMRIGVDGQIKKAMAYLGVDGTPKKCDVYIGVNGTPKKCG